MIPEELLLKYGAKLKTYEKGEILFSQHTNAKNYYQVKKGIVKMNNYNDVGKEFIQGIFYDGQSFGEPPLFIDSNYPANAETISEATVLTLPKKAFFQLLYKHPEIHLKVTKNLANRLFYKAIIASEISSQNPNHRILRFLDYLKKDVAKITGTFNFKIVYTRQQIADILGLRIETVIRAIKDLEKKSEVQIIKGKIFR